MLVLGITDGITCGAAVVADGRVLAAVNEERLARLKMAFGFPRDSIKEVLRVAGVSPDEIDLVTIATRNNYFFDGVRPFDGWFASDKGLIRNAVFQTACKLSPLVDRIPGLETCYYKTRWPIFASRRRSIRRIVRGEFSLAAPIEFVDHHLAHAASTYFTSGFKDALVVSMDGGGDGASSKVYIGRDGRLAQVGCSSAFHSLANWYAYVTHLCGFKAQKHEGKITGLAAHGAPEFRDLLASMIKLDSGKTRNVSGRAFLGAVQALEARLPHGWKQADLAASIQQHCEEVAAGYVEHYLRHGAPVDVALAGGLFANVRINQVIHELDGVNRLFVHPGMTDAGLAVGAALTPCLRAGKRRGMSRRCDAIRDVYYGPEYSSADIERELRDSGVEFSQSQSIELDVARLLAQGHVVARFNGRMEYGPRALGNRSILYQPSDRSVNDWLNESLKRTEFMPFAPSVLAEFASDCFHGVEGAIDAARFMTITFDCTQWTKDSCAGVVHIDGTARPQLVRREDNASFYGIIEEFRKLTGIPMIINTSFNMHEEPIVCSPRDAIRSFQQGNLDYLAIGNFLACSPRPISRSLQAAPGREVSM